MAHIDSETFNFELNRLLAKYNLESAVLIAKSRNHLCIGKTGELSRYALVDLLRNIAEQMIQENTGEYLLSGLMEQAKMDLREREELR